MTAPAWLAALARDAPGLDIPPALRPPAAASGRRSAVLLLFGERAGEPDLLIVSRSPALRRHAGQAAFPGGVIEPGDDGPAAAALREAAEEVGVDPAGVDVAGLLPELFLAFSGFRVVPVLAWWRRPAADGPGDGEITAAARVPLRQLADPANRVALRHRSGLIGPAFRLPGLLVWGFTGALVDRVLALGGWERPWDTGRFEELPLAAVAAQGDAAPPA